MNDLKAEAKAKKNDFRHKIYCQNWRARHPEKRKEYRDRVLAKDPDYFRKKARLQHAREKAARLAARDGLTEGTV